MGELILNIAGYRFIDLLDRDDLRKPLQELCAKLDLKGTILLSEEGINFFLAANESNIRQFISELEKDERFVDITLKESYTDYQPFNRMNVRLKKEIISVGMDEIQPSQFTGDEITPTEFKKWLDEGRDVAVLDARNGYELRVGTFENAIDLKIKSFRQFPKAAESLLEELEDTPIVMYCTGGVRCEKASAIMLNQGFKNVYQLKGGILGYFEEVGGDHWVGDCFVFDQRVSVNPQLEETGFAQCFACREPISVEEQNSPEYVVGESCPYCIGRIK
ncbi:MAG: sulfurtransferase [Candidatus Poseidoniaceae archaeon]|nr:sulfurtransferase [Candidatus Poseidoniaceae archaeon]